MSGLMAYSEALTYIIPPIVCLRVGIDLHPLVITMEGSVRARYSKALESYTPSWPTYEAVEDYLRVFWICKELSGVNDDGNIRATILLVDAVRHRTKPTAALVTDHNSSETVAGDHRKQLGEILEALHDWADPTIVTQVCRVFKDAKMEGWDNACFREFLDGEEVYEPPISSRYKGDIRKNIAASIEKGCHDRQLDIFDRQALHGAVLLGDRDLVVECLQAGFPSTDEDIFGWTLFHYAAWLGMGSIFAVLLKNSWNDRIIELRTLDGLSVLDCAAKRNHPSFLKEFLKAARSRVPDLADVTVDEYPYRTQWRTPLHSACFPYRDRAVKLLLKTGANPYIHDSEGRTAVELAAMSGSEAEKEVMALSRHPNPEC